MTEKITLETLVYNSKLAAGMQEYIELNRNYWSVFTEMTCSPNYFFKAWVSL